LGVPGPVCGRPKPRENERTFSEEWLSNMRGPAGRNFTDIHAGESFHALELNISALPAGSRPGLSRQFSNIFDPVSLDNWNTLFAQPSFVTCFSLRHRDTVLSYFFPEGK